MAQKDYEHLIDGICQLKNVGNPESKYQACNLVVENVPCMLLPAADLGELDHVAYSCDFGPLPETGRALALQRLLETNLYMFGANTPTFCCNPETNHIVLIGRVSLANINAESMLQVLDRLAAYAHEWRETHFLNDDEGTEAAPSSKAAIALGRSSRGILPH